MGLLDTHYRALIDYRKSTVANRECTVLRSAVGEANAEKDVITVTQNVVTVDREWVDEIESKIEYLDKCIKEERQFIRSNGEVVPVEKVKRVSVETVKHLARHTDLLSKDSTEDEIIPEELYTVERNNDYAVYENRFLYMLLCYLRDFITLRYNKILELSNTYLATLAMDKTLTTHQRHLHYKLEMSDEIKNDWYLTQHNPAHDIIEKIGMLLKTVVALLRTPLMEDVAKVPMLKPPIAKTNVLKMDNNFKQAMALYSYIISYNQDGYTVTSEKKVVSPFEDKAKDEFAETISLTAFLTYEYGLDLKKYLRDNYDEEERRRKAEEDARLLERIKLLRARIKDTGMAPDQYMLYLEDRNKALEACKIQLDQLRAEMSKQEQALAECREKLAVVTKECEDAKADAELMMRQYMQEIVDIKSAQAQVVERLNGEHSKAIENLNLDFAARVEQIDSRNADSILAINQKHADDVRNLTMQAKTAMDNVKRECDEKIAKVQEKYDRDKSYWKLRDDGREEVLAKIRAECNHINDERLLTIAKLKAMRLESGLSEIEDYTSKEAFGELERQYNLYQEFFKKEWRKTKKAIRKSVYADLKNFKQERGEKFKPMTVEEERKEVDVVPPLENVEATQINEADATVITVGDEIVKQPKTEESQAEITSISDVTKLTDEK